MQYGRVFPVAMPGEATDHPVLRASNINGDVALDGTVPSYPQYLEAAAAAQRVQDALDRNALVEDDSDVCVDASGSTVTLRGHVRTWAERDAVVSAAWMAGGVMQVRDDLDITG